MKRSEMLALIEGILKDIEADRNIPIDYAAKNLLATIEDAGMLPPYNYPHRFEWEPEDE